MSEPTTYPTINVEHVAARLNLAAGLLRGSVHPSAGQFVAPGLMDANVAATLADWLEAEALLLSAIKPFTALLNYGFEQASGNTAHLVVGTDDSGEVQMACESSNQALAVAESIIQRAAELDLDVRPAA